MNVREIMANVVRKVSPGDSLYKAARIMEEYGVGCLLVGDEDRLEGLLTDRDLVIRGLACPAELAGMKVADVMSKKPVCVREDDTVRQAAVIMESNQVRRLPVLDFKGKLAGIVSIGDICTHAPHELAGELIEKVSEPTHSYLAETA